MGLAIFYMTEYALLYFQKLLGILLSKVSVQETPFLFNLSLRVFFALY